MAPGEWQPLTLFLFWILWKRQHERFHTYSVKELEIKLTMPLCCWLSYLQYLYLSGIVPKNVSSLKYNRNLCFTWIHPGKTWRHSEDDNKSVLKVKGKSYMKCHEGSGMRQKQKDHLPLSHGKGRTWWFPATNNQFGIGGPWAEMGVVSVFPGPGWE
jgi:hypothetical protein